MGRPPAHRERGLELAESEERERREVGRFKTLEPVDELETLFEGASVQKITGFVEFWIRHADPKANAKPDALCRRALPANNATNNVANNAQLEGTIVKRAILTLITVSCLQTSAFATWSVIAVDRSTGQVIIASATCVPQTRFPPRPSRDLMDVQAVIVPGMGVAACQAGVDNTRANQMIVFAELKKGTAPEAHHRASPGAREREGRASDGTTSVRHRRPARPHGGVQRGEQPRRRALRVG